MERARSPSLSPRSLSISSTPGPRTSGQFPPLSAHGMPKEPSLLSPDSLVTRPHRFSGLPSSPRPSFSGLPPSPRPSEPPMSPMPALSPSGPGPLSPPMSGKSFGTFIDSEPSTPAYSPRAGSNWDDSTLVLLTPVKSSSGKSPREPKWDMMIPLQKPPKKRFSRHKPKLSISSVSSVSTTSRDAPATNTSLSSHPVGTIHEEAQKENTPPTKEEKEKDEEAPAQNDPLGKLAFRMKSLLKRRSHSEKKEKRSRTTFELDRVETVHWTEL